MLIAKKIESTAPVEIAVEIFAGLWKISNLIEFSTFPQALSGSSCGNVENSQLIVISKELN
jgi:hypothetical protein